MENKKTKKPKIENKLSDDFEKLWVGKIVVTVRKFINYDMIS